MFIYSIVEPRNYEEVAYNSLWIQAMKEELNALESNQT